MSNEHGAIQGIFGRAVLVDLDRTVVAHAHPHCHVLMNVSGVDSGFRVGGQDYPMTEDIAVLVNSWEPHGFPHAAGTPGCTMLGLYIDIDWLAHVDRTFGVSGNRYFFPHPCCRLPPGLRVQAYGIAESLKSGAMEIGDYEPLLLSLMIGVIENFSIWRELRHTRQATGPEISDFRLRRALRFMGEHLYEPVSMEQVARACCLSRPHFFELFGRAVGVTPNIYYSALRMEAAYKALPNTDMPLGHVAARLGFSAPSHFTRFFSNNLGIPPSEYRQLLRRGTPLIRSEPSNGNLHG
jgi:AraC family transcriptional regulator